MNMPESLQNEVAGICLEKRWRVAVAESCTGGLLGGRLTAVPGSSAYFLGGIVAYSNSLKHSLLQVPRDLLEKHGAVSEEVARAMAEGIVQVAGAEAGIAITGVAGPEGSEDKPPGTVYVAVRTPEGTSARLLNLGGGREDVREAAVVEAMRMFVQCARGLQA